MQHERVKVINRFTKKVISANNRLKIRATTRKTILRTRCPCGLPPCFNRYSQVNQETVGYVSLSFRGPKIKFLIEQLN